MDKNYALGMIQTWNAAFSKDLSRNWTLAATYTGTKGTDLDILREGIGLQAVAQQDPLVAYKREAFDMFSDLLRRALDTQCRHLPASPAPRGRSCRRRVVHGCEVDGQRLVAWRRRGRGGTERSRSGG